MFTFFIGKGGVGKTTVSSAYALHCAAKQPRRPILLLSTDPAHSLADILQVKLSDTPRRLPAAGHIWARQIDPRKLIDAFLRRERKEIVALLDKGSLFTRDELEPLLDTSLPGMAEVGALLAIHKLLDSEYAEIVVDTAPMGHAIRLFQMPEHFASFLRVLEAAASRDLALAQHFGGHVRREPVIERWAAMVERVQAAMSAGESKLVLVTTPESFSLQQAARSAQAFQTGGAKNAVVELVLNRVVTGKTPCAVCRERARLRRSGEKFLAAHFPGAKLFEAEDQGCPILGVKALRRLGEHIFAGKKLPRSAISKPPHSPSAKLKQAAWPTLEAPLTLTLGKGGVGKTTISASLAYHHRQSAKRDTVSICSIDPAPSLDDMFAAKIGDTLRPVLNDRKLLAAEFDAMAAFRQWAGELRAQLSATMTSEERGVHLDLTLDRQFLLALLDVVPPGIDEIFAIFRIMNLLESGQRVVIDMAPTGHALEVLRTPERLLAWSRLLLKTLAAHRTLPFARDAAVEIAKLSQKVRQLASILRDPQRCRLMVVTLPEPLPDHETRRLLLSLQELGAPMGAVFVNRVLMAGRGVCRRCALAMQWQAASLATLKKQPSLGELFVTPEFPHQIVGRNGLERFTRTLWQLA